MWWPFKGFAQTMWWPFKGFAICSDNVVADNVVAFFKGFFQTMWCFFKGFVQTQCGGLFQRICSDNGGLLKDFFRQWWPFKELFRQFGGLLKDFFRQCGCLLKDLFRQCGGLSKDLFRQCGGFERIC